MIGDERRGSHSNEKTMYSVCYSIFPTRGKTIEKRERRSKHSWDKRKAF
jgi:hypothetical protein